MWKVSLAQRNPIFAKSTESPVVVAPVALVDLVVPPPAVLLLVMMTVALMWWVELLQMEMKPLLLLEKEALI